MILINLLPHREEARKRRKQLFNSMLGLAAVGGLVLGGLAYAFYQYQVDNQVQVNNFIQAENSKLDVKIKDILDLEAEIAALRDRQNAVESLQQQRNDPVQLFNGLAGKIPDGVYLTGIKQTNEVVAIQGVAQSNERVSEFLRNLRDLPTLAKSPQLDETSATEVLLSNKTKSRVYNFKMALTLKKPENPADKKPAAPKPVPASSASKG